MRLYSVVPASLIFAAACGFEEPPPPDPILPEPPVVQQPLPEPPPPPPTAMQRLQRGVSMDLMASSSAISISVAKSGAESSPHSVAAARGRMSVRIASGDVMSNGLDVEIDDIEISPEEFPPSGVNLTNIRASMEFTKLETTWIDSKTGTFAGAGRLHVTWSLVRGDGAVLPVRPLDVASVPVDGEVIVTSDDRAELSIRGVARGELLDVAGLAQLSDLSIELMLVEPTQLP